ncbi:MAG: VanZ family protein [Ignavibacteria bacterium]|jgi:VanZ family protein
MSKFLAKIPAILCSIGIFYFSSLPQAPFVMSTFQWQDKFLHFFAYLFYGCTLSLAIHVHDTNQYKKNILWIILIGCLYAVSDEFHQSFVPGRTSEIGDIIADCLGIVCATMVYRYIVLRTSKVL